LLCAFHPPSSTVMSLLFLQVWSLAQWSSPSRQWAPASRWSLSSLSWGSECFGVQTWMSSWCRSCCGALHTWVSLHCHGKHHVYLGLLWRWDNGRASLLRESHSLSLARLLMLGCCLKCYDLTGAVDPVSHFHGGFNEQLCTCESR
jgi:hypothetical protein